MSCSHTNELHKDGRLGLYLQWGKVDICSRSEVLKVYQNGPMVLFIEGSFQVTVRKDDRIVCDAIFEYSNLRRVSEFGIHEIFDDYVEELVVY